MLIPRPEYPRPQLVRNTWLNLNGEWEFAFDNGKVGEDEKWFDKSHFPLKIIVPFCPESKLSEIEFTDFMPCVWYKRKFTIPQTFVKDRIILNIGAADYYAKVFINGIFAGEHKGGYTPFGFDITDHISGGENDITICVYDDILSHNQPCGKQSDRSKSYGCLYTRTTGIWQTVWLENADSKRITALNYSTDIKNVCVNITAKVTPECIGEKLYVSVKWNENIAGTAQTDILSSTVSINVQLSEKHLWDIGCGNLYDVDLNIANFDSVKSYFGMRSIGLDKNAFYLNGKKFFGRWVLDQGFYPDGVYTAPNDYSFVNDIKNSMALGFNGARLHEKIFDPRFLYWADRLGYTVWEEHANWGLKIDKAEKLQYFLPEWLEAIKRDMAHPSIIGWCPFNETGGFNGPKRQDDSIIKLTYLATKAADPTRPVIDTSGFCHVMTDIFDIHDYESDTEKFKAIYEILNSDIPYEKMKFGAGNDRQTYHGEPVFVSEYGGMRWSADNTDGWGYNTPDSAEAFTEQYKKLTETLLQNPHITGFCYTQLYDVEQEQNGLMTYDRKYKFDPEIFRKINTQTAAAEK